MKATLAQHEPVEEDWEESDPMAWVDAEDLRPTVWDRVNRIARWAAPVGMAALLIGGAATFAPKAEANIFDSWTGQTGSVQGCINSLGYPEECPDAEPNPGLSEVGKQEAAWAKQYGWDK